MRLPIPVTLMLLFGCGEPLIVPVDVTLRDANVAQTTGDGAAETPRDPNGEFPFVDGGVWVPGTIDDGGLARGDASIDAGGHFVFCYRLPDPVLSLTVGSVLIDPASDFISVSSDQALSCKAEPADPGLAENPDSGGAAPADNTLRTNYQRVDGKAILRGGRQYALFAPPEANPLDLKVLVAGVYAGDQPCEQREALGSIVTFPLSGTGCINLSPAQDSRFMRLPIEASWLIGSAALQLCDTTCESLEL